MTFKKNTFGILSLLVLMVFLVSGCNPETPDAGNTPTMTPTPPPATVSSPTATPTPTPKPVIQITMTSTPSIPSRCADLSGNIEVQVLVGPAEAVDLEPVAVGNVPFQVVSAEPPYLVDGSGSISYDAVLEKKWGTYTVTMDMDLGVEGDCSGDEGSELLSLVLVMSGEQLVVVEAEGFHGEYPWAGEQSRDAVFPLEDGASVVGEGWTFVLHLGGR